MYQKVLVLKVSNKSLSIFLKHHRFLQNGVTCMKNYWFYRYPVKVGQLL